jgi:hypothetical protein
MVLLRNNLPALFGETQIKNSRGSKRVRRKAKKEKATKLQRKKMGASSKHR